MSIFGTICTFKYPACALKCEVTSHCGPKKKKEKKKKKHGEAQDEIFLTERQTRKMDFERCGFLSEALTLRLSVVMTRERH